MKYCVPWIKLPGNVIKSLEENKRLIPSQRKKLVQIITDDICSKIEKPGKNVLAVIAQ